MIGVSMSVTAMKFTVKALKLNESLYELHRPEGLPTVQVVFFHGFQRDYDDPHLYTWTAGDEPCLWPQTWLVERFPGAHILTVSYYGDGLRETLEKYGNAVGVDMYLVAENLISDFLEAEIGQEPRCPVVLVGHSFGGLVVKQVCVKAFNQLEDVRAREDRKTVRVRNFVDNLKGVFFYSTPHRGIQDESNPFVDPVLLQPTGPLKEYVKILGNPAARLNYEFDAHWINRKDSRTAGLGENVRTKLGSFFGLIVSEGSSRYGEFNVTGEDHFSIARPKSITSRSFTAFKDFLKDIVDDPNYGPPANFQVLPELVGIEFVLEDAKRKLEQTPRMCFVGMGGVGKTTLAMALFNETEKHYQYTCFIPKVKELKGSADTKIEDAMFKRLHFRGKKWTGSTADFNFLRGKRFLLVLDDVSSERDLEMVQKLDGQVHEDSRFIATSRDPSLFRPDFEVYDSDLKLNPESSRKLFLTHAFPNSSIPNKTFEGLVSSFVLKCDGLPLSLQVLGKYLSGKNEEIWMETLSALETARKGGGLEKNLWATLKVSYDGLESEEEKKMFLDASTVFYNKESSIAMAAWKVTTKGEPKRTWDRLVELFLVREAYEMGEPRISMHEQLLSLGRRIASNPAEHKMNYRIIWNNSDKALNLLSTDDEDMDDLKEIIALQCCTEELKSKRRLPYQGTTSTPENRISISGKKLQKMQKLQYLWLEGIDIDQMNGSELPSIPSVSRQELQLPSTLVYLHLYGVKLPRFTFTRHEHNHMAILEIARCSGLHQLPDTFLLLQDLEHIELKDTSLERVPDVGELRSLKRLHLSWVPTANLPSLPKCLEDDNVLRDFPGPFDWNIGDGKFVRVPKVSWVNRSLCELYRQPGETRPSMQVVFFHGFQRREEYKAAHLSTWTSRDGSCLWPQTWLAEHFPKAQIFCVSYHSIMMKAQDMDMDTVVKDLTTDILDGNIGQRSCPVILVGHSFGGLVIKHLCTLNERQDGPDQKGVSRMDTGSTLKFKNFLHNVKGAFFYSTPHHRSLNYSIPVLLRPTGPLLKYVKMLFKQTRRLNDDFDILRRQRKDWRIVGVGESLPTKWGELEDVIVPAAFARYSMTDFCTLPGMDHISISRPESKITRSFTALGKLLRRIADDPQ